MIRHGATNEISSVDFRSRIHARKGWSEKIPTDAAMQIRRKPHESAFKTFAISKKCAPSGSVRRFIPGARMAAKAQKSATGRAGRVIGHGRRMSETRYPSDALRRIRAG
jgi:hypothetical protein